VNEASNIFFKEHRGGGSKVGHPPLILIHGAGGTHLHWPPELRRLRGEDVFVLDLPGHGRSSGDGEWAIEGYAKHVCDWMDANNLDHAVVVGHSMGGAIGIKMGLNSAERLKGLILVGTGGRLRVHPTILCLTASPEGLLPAVDHIITVSFGSQVSSRMTELAHAQMAETRPAVLHGDFLACDQFDVLPLLGEIATPTLVICGEEDQLTPLKYSRFLVDVIPNARLETIPSVGHMVMLEQPVAVAEAVKAFMNEIFG